SHTRNFLHHRGNERLPAEAWIDGHHQHEFKLIDAIGKGVLPRLGCERTAGLFSELADELKRAIEMGPDLRVDGNAIRAGVGERGNKGVGRRDHEMDVERLLRVWTDGLNHSGTNGDIGHEVTVHDIDVDPVATGPIDGSNFLAEAREIRRQNGGGDQSIARRCHRAAHPLTPRVPVSPGLAVFSRNSIMAPATSTRLAASIPSMPGEELTSRTTGPRLERKRSTPQT